MTVPAASRRSPVYTGNGVATSFAFTFKVFASTDVQVLRTNADGSISTLVPGSDYSVSLNADQTTSPGGSITYPLSGSPLPANQTLVILGNLPYDQTLSLPTGGNFNPVAVENNFDRTEMQIQQVNDKANAAVRAPVGETLSSLPPATSRKGRLLSFNATTGDAETVAPADGSAAALAADLSASGNVSKGAGQVGFNGSTAYSGLTVGARLLDTGSSPRSLGAVGDGVTDDAAAIQACLLYSKTLDLRNRSWKIGTTIDLPAGCVVDMRGATIIANTGATPLFKFDGAKDQVSFLGGVVNGTASAFLLLKGTSNAPSLTTQYARQIRLEGLHVTSSTIGIGIDMQDAVRQVFIDKCMFYTPNGINASGKCVEVHIAKSIIYSATGAAGTYGIKLRSTGGGAAYNEGWHIDTCTIDAFDVTFDVTDIFALTVNNSYVAAQLTGYAFQFQAPSTNLCEHINIGNNVIGGRVRFVASAGGRLYTCLIQGNVFAGVPGVAVAIENNAAAISVLSCKFKNGSGGAQGVISSNNNADIVCDDLDFDSTYVNGVVLNGANGANCYIGRLNGATSGDIAGVGRTMRLGDFPLHNTTVAGLKQFSSSSNVTGSILVGGTIASLPVGFARGERGDIIIQLPYSGANAATQNVQVNTPAGMVLQSGTGYSAGNLYVGAASGLLFARLPYYCTADGSGTLNVINQAGNTLTINNQAYIGVVRA